MKGYEYIRLEFDFGDLAELNRLGSAGWKVVAVVPSTDSHFMYWALLERPNSDIFGYNQQKQKGENEA